MHWENPLDLEESLVADSPRKGSKTPGISANETQQLWNHESSPCNLLLFFSGIYKASPFPISTWTVAFAAGFKSKALSHRGATESLNLFWVSPCPKRNDSCLDHRSSFAPFPNNLALHFFRCCNLRTLRGFMKLLSNRRD